MKNYRQLDSCQRCIYALRIFDYSDPVTFYCNKNKDAPDPISGAMGGYDPKEPREVRHKKIETWNKWAEKHSVDYNGICDEYNKPIVIIPDVSPELTGFPKNK